MAPPPAGYAADSDADDEFERSHMTSPTVATDDDTSPTESDPPSTENTPTTFGHGESDGASPRTIITEWTADECAGFIKSLGLKQYCETFLENEIVGEALVALRHEELKEMGIASVGHRLTILKGVYETKVKQDIPFEADHYVPLSAETSLNNKKATQEDISRLIRSLKLRDERIYDLDTELKKVTEDYRKLREELAPVFKLVREREEGLSSPAMITGTGSSAKTRHKQQASLSERGHTQSPHPLPSPTSPSYQQPLTSARGYPHNPGPTSTTRSAFPYEDTSTYMPYNTASTATTLVPESNHRGGAPTPTPGGRSRGATRSDDDPPPSAGPSSGGGSGGGTPSMEIFKSFRVSMDDPCHKVLPAALKKYNINADWRQYALYIVYGDQERCLGLDEKPLILFKQLDRENKKPMFMLRRHAAPLEGHSGPSGGGGMPAGVDGPRNNQISLPQLPGGML